MGVMKLQTRRSTEGSKITGSSVTVFTVPTDSHETDGTYAWDSTTMVLVQLESGDVSGLGYTYADEATGRLVQILLQKVVAARDVFAHTAILQDIYRYVRNLGETGITRMAAAAIDNALWDLKARLLDTPLVNLLGRVRDEIPLYGSGGFTTYGDEQLQGQLGEWSKLGFTRVKMKVGSNPDDDPRRVKLARQAIGDKCELFVDANGAYTVTQALRLAEEFAEQRVHWFEEPVSSDNLSGLNQVRCRVPIGLDIAAGEYGYTAWYFKRMIDAEAVTVLQADATRCGGITGFMNVAALCWAVNLPLSSHCGPSMHLHVCCAVPRAIHMEYFHDHTRIERMFFDGFCDPQKGMMKPDLSRPGHGLELKEKDAAAFRV
jgi:L-alanine-DL-glutamate epimerase-like enolase superfamily enzyme